MRPSLVYTSVIGSNPQCTVNSGPRAQQKVFVTPISQGSLSSNPPLVPQSITSSVRPANILPDLSTGYRVEKVMLKAVCKGVKKDPKTFTLRNINTDEVLSCGMLKHVIKSQLCGDIISCEDNFDVGVVQGSNVVSIRTKEDLMDVWNDIKKGNKVILWCDGLRPKRPKLKSQTEDSDEEDIKLKRKTSKKAEEREEKVHNTLKKVES